MRSTATPRADLMTVVAAAVRAPSIHNTQPWKFRVLDGAIEVYADRSRQLPVADPDASALRISCGAAIFNIRLALAQLGCAPEVRLLPDRQDPDLLARIGGDEQRTPTPGQTSLYRAIFKRHSNRQPFIETAISPALRAGLVRAATAEGAWLDPLIGGAALAMVSELVRAADQILVSDDGYREELRRWTRDDGLASDGVPDLAGGSRPEPYDLLARRDFHGPARAPGHDYETDPLVAVLGAASDSPLDDLVAGQALQSVLLTATSAELATSLISQPIHVPRIREQLRLGLRRYGSPHILLRIGYGLPGRPTPRRPIDDVMLLEPRCSSGRSRAVSVGVDGLTAPLLGSDVREGL